MSDPLQAAKAFTPAPTTSNGFASKDAAVERDGRLPDPIEPIEEPDDVSRGGRGTGMEETELKGGWEAGDTTPDERPGRASRWHPQGVEDGEHDIDEKNADVDTSYRDPRKGSTMTTSDSSSPVRDRDRSTEKGGGKARGHGKGLTDGDAGESD